LYIRRPRVRGLGKEEAGRWSKLARFHNAVGDTGGEGMKYFSLRQYSQGKLVKNIGVKAKDFLEATDYYSDKKLFSPVPPPSFIILPPEEITKEEYDRLKKEAEE
jgi:hypothetical protein